VLTALPYISVGLGRQPVTNDSKQCTRQMRHFHNKKRERNLSNMSTMTHENNSNPSGNCRATVKQRIKNLYKQDVSYEGLRERTEHY